MKRTEKGFTIIELMVVVLIAAILTTVAVATFNGAKQRAEERDHPTPRPTPTTVPEADPERFEQRRVGDMVCVWDLEKDEAQACVLPTPVSTP